MKMELTNLEKLKTRRYKRKITKDLDLYLQFMKENNLESCYDPTTDDCSGGCQGCSDCLIARWLRDEIKKPTPLQKRRESYDYFIATMSMNRILMSLQNIKELKEHNQL